MERGNIERIDNISLQDFKEKYLKKNKPVIINNLTTDWMGHAKWNIDYIEEKSQESAVGVIPIKSKYLDLNNEDGSKYQIQKIKEVMSSIKSEGIEDGLAIASPIEMFPEEIMKECPPPELCNHAPFLRGRVFIGPKGIITTLHQDLFENLYTIVRGSKQIILYPPNAPVYRNSIFSKLPNHSKVDPENPNYHLYPKFKDAQSIIIQLKEGETLYIPSFWWHYLRNLDQTMAVSYWWGHGWKLSIAWLASVYKKTRNI